MKLLRLHYHHATRLTTFLPLYASMTARQAVCFLNYPRWPPHALRRPNWRDTSRTWLHVVLQWIHRRDESRKLKKELVVVVVGGRVCGGGGFQNQQVQRCHCKATFKGALRSDVLTEEFFLSQERTQNTQAGCSKESRCILWKSCFFFPPKIEQHIWYYGC